MTLFLQAPCHPAPTCEGQQAGHRQPKQPVGHEVDGGTNALAAAATHYSRQHGVGTLACMRAQGGGGEVVV